MPVTPAIVQGQPGSPSLYQARAVALAELTALTEAAQNALGDRSHEIYYLPFRVGRERRHAAALARRALERRLGVAEETNDLYLVADPHDRVEFISRDHFAIWLDGQEFVLADRGSRYGTYLDGRRIGGDGRPGQEKMADRQVIALGSPDSPYVFRFLVGPGMALTTSRSRRRRR